MDSIYWHHDIIFGCYLLQSCNVPEHGYWHHDSYHHHRLDQYLIIDNIRGTRGWEGRESVTHVS